MKQFDPIPVYPLNMRGRFGLTRHICRHGLGSVLFYTLFYALICALLVALCLVPLGLRLLSDMSFSQLLNEASEFFRSLLVSFSDGPTSFFWSWEAPNDFLFDGGSMLFGVLGCIGLSILSLGFYAFYLKPRYLGAIYNEMGSRIYGSSGSVGEISHRAGFCLRRYYTTYLALIVGKIGASVIVSFIARALGLLFAGLAVVAVLFSGFGGVLAGLVLFLISMFLGYMSLSLLTLCYPVAVAEDKRDFSALGRSISLGWKNFGRMLSSLILRDLYVYLWMLPGTILLSISVFSHSLRVPLMAAAIVWIVLARLYFIPFRLAFDTVLYYDAVARELQTAPAGSAPNGGEAANTANGVSQEGQTPSETVFESVPEDAPKADENNTEQNEIKE